MDTHSYIAKQAKPKINVPPVFESIPGAADPVNVTESYEKTAQSLADSPAPLPRTRYTSGWDFRFAVGLVVSIIIINTALVLLLTENKGDTASDGFQPVTDDDGDAYTRAPSVLRPVRTSRDLEQDQTVDGTTGVYVSQEQRQLLLRQLNTVTTHPSEDDEEVE